MAYEYATKRYRSNLINWGILPFTMDSSEEFNLEPDTYILIPGIRKAVESGREEIEAKIVAGNEMKTLKLYLKNLTKDEREIILCGSLTKNRV